MWFQNPDPGCGMRRRGLLNIKVPDVAQRNDDGKWVADIGGRTIEKGRKNRTFPIFPGVRILLEKWLNTSEVEGGRPHSPSPYLFPSEKTDNGQMSVSTLDRLFRKLCQECNIEKSMSHPHILRHSCAHRLLEMGNTSRQIAAYLGHSSASTTEKYYLRDTTENITSTMNLPWADPKKESKPDASEPPLNISLQTLSNEDQPSKKKKPSRDLLREVLALRQQQRQQDAPNPAFDCTSASTPHFAPL